MLFHGGRLRAPSVMHYQLALGGVPVVTAHRTVTYNGRKSALNDVMEFDHVIVVGEDGTVSDAEGVYAPELYDGEVSSGWSLMGGYSGQHGHSGPIMHSSEFIGGGMADDILSTPGIYVAVVDCASDDADGWAVAKLICQWFARCDNYATHAEPHPMLGFVPACDRCVKIGRD